LEALSCGVPVVVSDIPQIRSIIENSGLSFKIGDVDELVENITKLLLNPKLRHEFGIVGRRRVCENHSWDRFVDTIVQLYQLLSSYAG